MGGLIVDAFAAYLIKSVSRMIQRARSANWRRVSATISDVSVSNPGFGCPSVRIRYQIKDAGQYRDSEDVLPFTWIVDAERFAQRFSGNDLVTIRENPADTNDSHYFIVDQG